MRPSMKRIVVALPHVLMAAYVTFLSAPGLPSDGTRTASLAATVLLGIALRVGQEAEAAMT
jgi:hypothetical protein